MTTTDLVTRMLLSFVLGAAIGAERQWRARNAGLRTSTLVSLGSCLFVVFGAYSFTGDVHADPTRVAAQVVSGIGFLGAGVIMKQGASITGLNTAATLWASAAIGCLAGTGRYEPAVIGTVFIMLTNTLLRPLGRRMDRHPVETGREEQPVVYEVDVSCAASAEPHTRQLIVQAARGSSVRLQSLESVDAETPGLVEVRARLYADARDDDALEDTVSHLGLEPSVVRVGWKVAPGLDEAFYD